MKVKINNKNYEVPQLEFGHFVQMEDMGFVVQDILSKGQIMSICTAFVGIVTGLDREESENLIQQHILGGGKLGIIMDAFNKAARESSFFRKMMGMEAEEAPEISAEKEQEKATE